jgi:hypothetical protein
MSNKFVIDPPIFFDHSLNNVEFLVNHVNWNSKLSKGMLEALKRSYGLPSVIAPQPGGSASWFEDKIDKPFFRVELYDEPLYSKTLSKRVCFSTSINFEVLDKYLLDVLKLCDTLCYCPLRKVLKATGSDRRECLAILTIAVEIANGKLKGKDMPKHSDLLEVISKAHNDSTYTTQLQSKLLDNVKHALGNPIVVIPNK